jgi:3-oxoacyl-[acyl-carrier protein] reductase
MDFGISNKVALVAAASRGLGFACAKALADEGAAVCICARTEDKLEEAAQKIQKSCGREPLAVACDVANDEQRKNLIERTRSELGPISILINNAGGPPLGAFNDHDSAAWEKAFHTNFLSAVELIRLCLPEMRAARYGRIVNITSIAVKEPIDGLMLSNAVRAAIHGMTKTLAREEAKNGVTVNNICPGIIETDRIHELARMEEERSGGKVSREQSLQRRRESSPFGRMGRPEEIGAVAAFLCSTQASYLTGVSLLVDGGMSRAV